MKQNVPFLLQILILAWVRELTRGRIIFQRTENQDGAPTIIITSCMKEKGRKGRYIVLTVGVPPSQRTYRSFGVVLANQVDRAPQEVEGLARCG